MNYGSLGMEMGWMLRPATRSLNPVWVHLPSPEDPDLWAATVSGPSHSLWMPPGTLDPTL